MGGRKLLLGTGTSGRTIERSKKVLEKSYNYSLTEIWSRKKTEVTFIFGPKIVRWTNGPSLFAIIEAWPGQEDLE